MPTVCSISQLCETVAVKWSTQSDTDENAGGMVLACLVDDSQASQDAIGLCHEIGISLRSFGHPARIKRVLTLITEGMATCAGISQLSMRQRRGVARTQVGSRWGRLHAGG